MSYIHDIVDLGCYPIDRPESSAYRRMMADLQQELREDGCAVLSGFVHAQGLTDMVREADAVAQYGHKSFSRKNAYFSQDDPSLDAGHPVRQFTIALMRLSRRIISAQKAHCAGSTNMKVSCRSYGPRWKNLQIDFSGMTTPWPM